MSDSADLNYMIGFNTFFVLLISRRNPDAALRYAVALAGAYEAKLTVCHCAEAPSPVDEAAREIQKAWSPASGDGRASVIVRPPITRGSSSKAIQRSDRQDGGGAPRRPDRDALAAACSGGAPRFRHEAARRGPCPVLVTHPDEREWAGLTSCEIDLRKILVAQDFSSSPSWPATGDFTGPGISN